MSDRDYQARIISEIRRKASLGKKRIMVVLPTGGGKGYISARLIQMASEKGRENVFFAAQRELINQIGSQLDRLGVSHNVLMASVVNEYAGFNEAVSGSISTLAAKDTLWSRGFRSSKIKPPAGELIQIDECHGMMTRTYGAILDHYSDSIHVGWTATPCRADGVSLGCHFDDIVVGATYKELQDLGFLVPVKVFAPDRPDLKGMYGKEFSQKELDKRMNKSPLVGSIVNEWRKNSAGRGTVVFASGVSHSIHLRDEFRKVLGKNADGSERSEHIDGKLEQKVRDDIMDRVRSGKVDVLCNYGVAHTGVDVPSWKYLICARPTKSFGLWRQMGGRIQRPYMGASEAVIQDHSDNAHRFGYPDEDVAWTIEDGVKAQDLPRTVRNKPPHESGEKEKESNFKCVNCSTPFRGARCPNCGRVPERIGYDVDSGPGTLKELERKSLNSKSSLSDKQKCWDECLGWAIGSGRKVGAAAHRYKKRYGVWPSHQIQDVPRSSQWKMNARDFYVHVVKPAKEKLKKELEGYLQ